MAWVSTELRPANLINERREIMKNCTMVIIVAMILWFGSVAWAEFVPPENIICPSFQWDASSESDLASYRVHRIVNGVSMSSVTVSKDITTIECEALKLPEGSGSEVAAVTAVDTSGNESPWSNLVPFSWYLPDKTAPALVVGFCQTMEAASGGLVRVCMTVMPIETP